MLKTVFRETIIVAGTNITNRAARIVLSEERTGTEDTYIRADCPNPLTITKDTEANKKVIESLSPTLSEPTKIPKITNIIYGMLLAEPVIDF